MKLSVLFVIFAVTCVSAQTYLVQVAYLNNTCTGTSVGGSASLFSNPTYCVKNATTNQYAGYGCNGDTAWYANCSDSACSVCTLISAVPACQAVNGGVATAYIHFQCSALANVPVPTALGNFVGRTYPTSACVTPATFEWGPETVCIPDTETPSSYQYACNASYTTVTSFAGGVCAGVGAKLTIENNVCTSLGSVPVQYTCPGTSTSTTSKSTTSTTGGSLTTGTSGHNSTSTTTSGASFVAVSAFVIVSSVLAAAF